MSRSCNKNSLWIFLALGGLALLIIALLLTATPAIGIQAQLTNDAAGTILDGDPILFNAVLNNANPAAITYDSATGIFTLHETGTYLVTWWVSVNRGLARTVTFSAVINGSTSIPATSPLITGQLSGTALVTVTTAPASISIVNQSGAFVLFIGAIPQANVTINRVR